MHQCVCHAIAILSPSLSRAHMLSYFLCVRVCYVRESGHMFLVYASACLSMFGVCKGFFWSYSSN